MFTNLYYFSNNTIALTKSNKLNDSRFVQNVFRTHIAAANLDTKEDYLQWVANWKNAVKELETAIRQIKAARKPSDAVISSLWKEYYEGWSLPKADKERYASWSAQQKQDHFACQLQWALPYLKAAATELYRARANMKLASAMKRQLSK